MSEILTIEGAPMAAPGSQVTIQKIPLNKIKLSKNSRMNIDPEELDGLMQSIKEEGLLQPIGVIDNGKFFEICYGNRRYLAVSKLGLSSIPAIVHQKKKESDVDIKNLTENIQRRNISLAEIGRYIELLRENGLSAREAAVRLGVTNNYIENCIRAFNDIPKEFQQSLEINIVKTGRSRAAPGKISMATARKILSAQKSGKINREQKTLLLTAARDDERFSATDLPRYIHAMAIGKKSFLDSTPKSRMVNLQFIISGDAYNELVDKHVENGPFKSIREVFLAILKGEKNIKIPVIR